MEHLEYELINADVVVEGKQYNTYLCASYDYKRKGESKVALDNYYDINRQELENHMDFCIRMGFRKYIDTMLALDYIILNRDRHGANIELLRDERAHTIRLAPLVSRTCRNLWILRKLTALYGMKMCLIPVPLPPEADV